MADRLNRGSAWLFIVWLTKRENVKTTRHHVQIVWWIWQALRIDFKLTLHPGFMHADACTASIRISYCSCEYLNTVWLENSAESLEDVRNRNAIKNFSNQTLIKSTDQKNIWMFKTSAFRVFYHLCTNLYCTQTILIESCVSKYLAGFLACSLNRGFTKENFDWNPTKHIDQFSSWEFRKQIRASVLVLFQQIIYGYHQWCWKYSMDLTILLYWSCSLAKCQNRL